MKERSDSQILAWLEREYAEPFAGWDFSYLNNRRNPMGSLPWDYAKIAERHLTVANSVLDIDTGGGELFSRYLTGSAFAGTAHAVEPFAPNVLVARNELEQQQVEIHDTSQNSAKFDDDSFELILSRHGGSIGPNEIRRILTSGAKLVTEQIGDQTNYELRKAFGLDQELNSSWPHNAESAARVFSDLGFEIGRLDSHSYPVRFMDVGAIVYYLKAVPWEVPGFNVLKHQEALLRLHQEVETKGYAIDATYHSYLAVLKKS